MAPGAATYVVVSTAAGSIARQMLPRVAETVLAATRGPQRPLQHLLTVRHARWLLEQAETFLIDAARADGASWGQIAQARGTTRQNERQADQRRRAAAAREPLDRWLDAQRERFRDQQRRSRRPRPSPQGSSVNLMDRSDRGGVA